MNAPSTKTVSVSSNKGFRAAVRRKRRGYTLIEVLIGATLTLILLGIMIRAFTFAGDAISKGRAVIELSNELRTASDTLRHDLRSATASMLPWSTLGSDQGYFEIIEGPTRDYTFFDDGAGPAYHADATLEGSSLTTFGDGDDVIAFTARNLEQPYQGIFGGAVIESKVAEIVWWTVLKDINGDAGINADETVTLYRRVLLVAPSLNNDDGFMDGTQDASRSNVDAVILLGQFQQNNDVSFRYDTDLDAIVANSLADLTKRESRFAHDFVGSFPHAIVRDPNTPPVIPVSLEGAVLSGQREGEDVILSHVSAFDVQIYDPKVVIRGASQADGSVTALMPSDWGYWLVDPTTNFLGTGGYVDLNYSFLSTAQFLDDGSPPDDTPNRPYPSGSTIYLPTAATPFSALPTAKSLLRKADFTATYCTWSSSYERDGVNQDIVAEGGSPLTDEGTDGIDNDGTFGVDDEGERETSPPYPYPVRGVKVTFRVRDPASQQLRQTSVESSFIPE